MQISMRAPANVNIATKAAERQRDDKEEVACRVYPALPVYVTINREQFRKFATGLLGQGYIYIYTHTHTH
jgi:hypothetical protein